MSELIAGLYEIGNQIGSGGGGVVYLGRHVRLEKTVVLKADKRRLGTDAATLRREVDLLKGLTHTYIPQVYDFVQEGDTVFTVMDYIEGESLDKILKRDGKIPQPQVIQWACQLLSALQYLHAQPPHGVLHGDIKPSNVMRRPNGDICLIDYNIALALGEDGAVKVGFSAGYASPEHYGVSYISDRRKEGEYTARRTMPPQPDSAAADTTELLTETTELLTSATQERTMAAAQRREDETEWLFEPQGGAAAQRQQTPPASPSASAVPSGTGTGRGKGVMLDVRSDIYSLGSTLYHLISGRRPDRDAAKVQPLTGKDCSPAVAAIITKAMNPVPALRYQSAEEMLEAFLGLYRNDARVKRRRRRITAVSVALSLLMAAGAALTFIGMRQRQQRESALKLAEYSANALAEGDVDKAISQALEALPEGDLFAPESTAQAQKALADALNIYDLEDHFTARDVLELPAEPFRVKASADETYAAVVYAYETALIETKSGEILTRLPMAESAMADVVFTGEQKLLYAGKEGVSLYDIPQGKTLWSAGEGKTLSVSGDGKRAAVLNPEADGYLLMDMQNGETVSEHSFGGARMKTVFNDKGLDTQKKIFALSEDGSYLAASLENGGMILFSKDGPDSDLVLFEESGFRHFSGLFYKQFFFCACWNESEACLYIIDTKEQAVAGQMETELEGLEEFLLKEAEEGAYIAMGNRLVYMNMETLEQEEIAYTESRSILDFSVDDGYTIVTTTDHAFSFYGDGAKRMSVTEGAEWAYDFAVMNGGEALLGNRNEPLLRRLSMQTHEDAIAARYDASCAHDEARITHDKKNIMLFDINGFRIFTTEGEPVAEVSLEKPGEIYDQQFRRDENGSRLEVIWYDGTVKTYSATDGKLLSEEKGEARSKDLPDIFLAGPYRIESVLHQKPEVYLADSGEHVMTLTEDAMLTYVTYDDPYLVTEYIGTDMKRYALLMNGSLETIAVLPALSDIYEGILYFDYHSGDLRTSPIYSLEELREMAQNRQEESGG